MCNASKYVRANDLKSQETFNSKYFVLGVYDLKLDMSSRNPALFNRLANIDMEITIAQGKGSH
jgi:hypothetical protein